MIVREPVAADRLYPAEAERCHKAILTNLNDLALPPQSTRRGLGGIVPHGAWSEVGAVMAEIWRRLSLQDHPDVVIMFGGAHTTQIRQASMFGSGRWETPCGALRVDDRLADRLLGHTNLIADDVHAHEGEDSLEVHAPFVAHLFPNARILPILVPAIEDATEVGEAVARTLDIYQYRAIVVGAASVKCGGPSQSGAPAVVEDIESRKSSRGTPGNIVEHILGLRARDLVADPVGADSVCCVGAMAATIRAVVSLGATEAHSVMSSVSNDARSGFLFS